MQNLGDIIAQAENITEVHRRLNFIDGLHLEERDFRIVMHTLCRTVGVSLAAYARYGERLLSEEERENLLVAAYSPQGASA